jgi:hypothetical protein
MSIPRPTVMSFIVKIWIDEGDDPDAMPAWHGMVAEVADPERRYVKDLSEISAFIGARLARLGVRVSRDPSTEG